MSALIDLLKYQAAAEISFIMNTLRPVFFLNIAAKSGIFVALPKRVGAFSIIDGCVIEPGKDIMIGLS